MSQRERVPEWRVQRALDVLGRLPPVDPVSHRARLLSGGATELIPENDGVLTFTVAYNQRSAFRDRYLEWFRAWCVEFIVRRIRSSPLEEPLPAAEALTSEDRDAIRVAVDGDDRWRAYVYSMLDSASRALETVTDEQCLAVIRQETRDQAIRELFAAARRALDMGIPDSDIDRAVSRAKVSEVLDGDHDPGDDGGGP